MSNYSTDHECKFKTKVNKNVLGMFKNECPGIPIVEFVGLRLKRYAIKTERSESKRAKLKFGCDSYHTTNLIWSKKHRHDIEKLNCVSSIICSEEKKTKQTPIDKNHSKCTEIGTSHFQTYATIDTVVTNQEPLKSDEIVNELDDCQHKLEQMGTSNDGTYQTVNSEDVVEQIPEHMESQSTDEPFKGALISDEVVTCSKLDDHEDKLEQMETSNGYTHKIDDGKKIGQTEQIPNCVLGNMCSREVKPGPIPNDAEPSKCRENGKSAKINTFITNHEALTCDEVVNKLNEDKLEHMKTSNDYTHKRDDGKEMGKTEHIPNFVSGNMCSQEFEPTPIPTDAISSKHDENGTVSCTIKVLNDG
ncbi:unnamed protein product [Mytilus coruscus]|uniref:Uncharacterized protein n=1 Tax=Mytilus coruscus TaxID=42192 RepID=A0A6J8DM59_MYTCO|nr:unnamed protein product [Mytilus coruscus]